MAAIEANKGNNDLAERFANFSSKMAQTRANLRIFDDLATAQSFLDYGWGEKEPDQLLARMGVLTNIFDHLYYESHTFCWLVQNKIINIKDSDRWNKANSVIWVTSIFLNLLK